MKKTCIAVLGFVALTLVTMRCDNKPEEVIPETPTYMVKVRGEIVGEPGTNGLIKWSEWDSVLVIPGPGSFISAVVSRNGGTSNRTDQTTVRLSLDHKDIALKSFEVARAMGLSQQNYSGIVWLDGEDAVETLVLGYTQPLYFEEILLVSVLVDSTIDDVGDNRVKKLLVSLTYTKKHTGDDDHMGGGDHQPRFP